MAKPVLFLNVSVHRRAPGYTYPVALANHFAAPRHTSSVVILTASAIVDWDEPRVTGSVQNAQKRSCTHIPGYPAVPYTISPHSLIARSGNFENVHTRQPILFRKERGTAR